MTTNDITNSAPVVRKAVDGSVIPAVKAVQVHKAFGPLHVLKGIDLTVMPGTVTVILGPSGSGKSTLVNEILYKSLAAALNGARSRPGQCDEVQGMEWIDKVIGIDQAGRINLSIKQVAPPPPRPARQGGGQQRFGGGGRPPRQGGGSRPMGFVRQAPKEPTDFEDRLKQFMQSSDSKLSELRYIEKKGNSRRSRR